jgi:FHS family L-fucose permease-like MFS transporter
MAGRFIGTLLMRYFNPVKLLVTYAVINVVLIIAAVNLKAEAAVYTLMAVWFFMSIMFPTIFSLSIRDLTAKTKKLGSSLVIMSIVGGAIMPPIMGRISDKFNIQVAYLVPGISFVGYPLVCLKKFEGEEGGDGSGALIIRNILPQRHKVQRALRFFLSAFVLIRLQVLSALCG